MKEVNSLAELDNLLQDSGTAVFIYGLSTLSASVKTYLQSREISFTGPYDSFKTGVGIGSAADCATNARSGDLIFVCTSRFESVKQTLLSHCVDVGAFLVNAYSLFSQPLIRRVSAFSNIDRADRIFLSGTDTKSLVWFNSLSSLGYDRIEGFVSNNGDTEFLNLPVISSGQYVNEHASEKGVILTGDSDFVFFECANCPNVYLADWAMQFLTVPELIFEKTFIDTYAANCRFAFDVGANQGSISLLLVGLAEKVIGFEPNRDLHEIIETNLRGFTNFQLADLALSDEPGVTELFLDEKTTGGSSLEFNKGVHSKKLTVNVTTLDDFCRENHVAPDFLKVDAEGFDGNVILGGTETIKKHRPPIVFEMWRHSWHLVKEAVVFLGEMYDFIDLSTGLPFVPEDYEKHAEAYRKIGDLAGHTNIGCIPRQIPSGDSM